MTGADKTTTDEPAADAAVAPEPAAQASAPRPGLTDALRKGRDDAVRQVGATVPAVKNALSKGVYMVCYGAAFGVVYTSELVMSVVPEDSAIRSGLTDGGAQARAALHRAKAPAAPSAGQAVAA